jgi:hypothetical protein
VLAKFQVALLSICISNTAGQLPPFTADDLPLMHITATKILQNNYITVGWKYGHHVSREMNL